VHGSLFFGAIDHVQRALQGVDGANPQQKHVLLVANGINFADIAGAEMLMREARRRRRIGGGLYLVGVKERLLDALQSGHYLHEIGPENVFRAMPEAIERIRQRLDEGVCGRCERRVFPACGNAPARRLATAGLEATLAAAAFAEAGDADGARRILQEAVADGSAEAPGGAAEPAAPAAPARARRNGARGTDAA
jgi:hypothetical protein